MNKSVVYMKTSMKCDSECVDNHMIGRQWTDYNQLDIMMRCPCDIPIGIVPVGEDFEGADFFKMTHTDFTTILADGNEGAAGADAGTTETA